MPDGQGPATAEQQVRFEVTIDKVMGAMTRALGGEYHPGAAGGGGKDGKWVFTSVEQLDAMIKRWTDVRDAIRARRDAIERAKLHIDPPAPDIMSRLQAHAFASSLEAMRDHADNMFNYAKSYVEKLVTTRSEYVTTESGNTADIKSADKD